MGKQIITGDSFSRIISSLYYDPTVGVIKESLQLFGVIYMYLYCCTVVELYSSFTQVVDRYHILQISGLVTSLYCHEGVFINR